MNSDHLPLISIVIPVRNEAAHIEEVLDALLAQEYPPDRMEILVIDGHSTDETREKVAPYVERSREDGRSRIFLYENPDHLSSAARSIGVERMNGDVFLLVDGHCLIESPHMLAAVAEAFEDETVDCLGRPQPLEMRGANLMQHAIAAARRSPLGHHPDSFIYSGQARIVPAISVAVAYRKRVFDLVGGFDKSFDAAEDVEFNHRCDRAGLRCLFEPRIAVHYVPRRSLVGLFRQLARYGRGRIRLLRKHRDTFSLKSLLPALFVLGLLLGPIPGLFYRPLWIVYAAVLGLYLLIVLFESVRLGCVLRDRRLPFVLPFVFPVIHIGSGWGLLTEIFRPGRRRKPEP